MLPVIETARLKLRPLRPADGPRMQAYASDFDVARMLSLVPHPYPEGEAAAFIEDMMSAPNTETPWQVFAIDHDGFIGTFGLTSETGFKGGSVDIGYWIGKPWWGRGLMSEALKAMLQLHIFGTLFVSKVTSGMFFDNPASWRLQEKFGFVRVGTSHKYCLARGRAALHWDTELTRDAFERTQVPQ